MSRVFEILLLLFLPLAFGLVVDFVFERLRRRRGASSKPSAEWPHDWVI